MARPASRLTTIDAKENAMPNEYVEDYEELTGKKPQPEPVDAMGTGTEAKVVTPAKKAAPKKATKAETK